MCGVDLSEKRICFQNRFSGNAGISIGAGLFQEGSPVPVVLCLLQPLAVLQKDNVYQCYVVGFFVGLLLVFFFLSLLDISVLKYSLSLLSQDGDFNTILIFGATVYLNRSVYVIIGSH